MNAAGVNELSLAEKGSICKILSKRVAPEHLQSSIPRSVHQKNSEQKPIPLDSIGVLGDMSVIEFKIDSVDMIDRGSITKYQAIVTAVVKITMRDGTSHEDVGCGVSKEENLESAAIEAAKEDAIIDAQRRVLIVFGFNLNKLGSLRKRKNPNSAFASKRTCIASTN